MHIRSIQWISKRYPALILLGFIACAGPGHFRRGIQYLNENQWEQAIAELESERLRNPDNIKAVIALDRARAGAAAFHADRGRDALSAGDPDRAKTEFERALRFDPSNALAQNTLRSIDRREQSFRFLETGRKAETDGDFSRAKSFYREALKCHAGNLEARNRFEALAADAPDGTRTGSGSIIVSFSFNQAGLPDIFRALAAVSSINILIDDTMDDNRRITVDLKDISAGKAIESLAKTYGMLTISLDPNTLLITPDTPENRARYALESVRLFNLKYADCEEVKKILTPVLKTAVVLADNRLNSVVVRTDPEQLKLASELINAIDRRESEVLIELEVLEITRGKLQDLGLHLGDDPKVRVKAGGGIKPAGGSESSLSLSELRNLTEGQVFLTLPSLYLDLLKQDSHTRILSQPRLRILNRTPARLHVGEKVPVKVTTSRYRDTSEETSVYEYKDVGLLMEMTPKIISESEMALDLKLEVSSILSENQAGQPTIGTRELNTTLRLSHSETEIIAGLIKDEERTGTTRIPLLGDIPVLGRFFSSLAENTNQTDIVIALTPHLLDRDSWLDLDETVWSGSTFTGGTSGVRFRTAVAADSGSVEAPEGDIEQPGIIPENDGTTPGESPGTEPAETAVAEITLSPDPLNVSVQATRTVSVVIRNARNVGSTPFYLEFDPAAVEIGAVEEGMFLSADGAPTAFMSSIDSERGRLIIGLTRLGSKTGVDGSGELVRIEIVGKAPGTAALRFTHNSVTDPWAKEMPSRFRDGTVEVVP